MDDLLLFDQRIGEAFCIISYDEKEICIDAIIRELINKGYERSDILNILEKYRLLFEKENRANDLDLLTGFMDRLVGGAVLRKSINSKKDDGYLRSNMKDFVTTTGI